MLSVHAERRWCCAFSVCTLRSPPEFCFLQRTHLVGLYQCTLSKCQKIHSRETINHVSLKQDSMDAV